MKKYYHNFGRFLELSHDLPAFRDIEDRFKHFYLIGLSGMGKSTAIENLAHYDLSEGYSVIFIDPKGDSADKLYYHFRDDDNIRYVSFEKAIRINPFDKHGEDLENLIDEFVQIFDNVITATSSNPLSTTRMREIISHTIPALQPEDRTFDKIYEFLFYKPVRYNYPYTDPEYKRWWINLFDPKQTDYKKRSDFELTMSSISSRLKQVTMNSKTGSFINGSNELDINDLITNGKSLIVNLSGSNFFGRLFVANMIVGSLHSYLNKKKKSKPCFIYIDEFDLVASTEFEETLQLARSSNVGFVLAHQNFSSSRSENHRRMMNGIIETIFGAVSNYLTFNTSPKVARQMSDVYNLTIQDFLELDKYEARLRIGNERTYIETKKPVLIVVPDDFIFPTLKNPQISQIDFLRNDWIEFT